MDKSTIGLLKNNEDLPSIDEDATEPVLTLEGEAVNTIVPTIIIALGVVLTIGLLFGMAIFFDCRNKKRAENGEPNQRRSLFNFTIPSFFKFRRFSNEDEVFARQDSEIVYP